MSTQIITGAAGFIGYHVALTILAQGDTVIGIDTINHAYNPLFKEHRLTELKRHPKFIFHNTDITHKRKILQLFKLYRPEIVFHLAARTGVRKSIRFPGLYHRVNVIGTINVYMAAAQSSAQQFIFASSSSVYGNSNRIPFSVTHKNLRPTSPYAKSKNAAEDHLLKLSTFHKLPVKIARLFSVYGPHGRPDMAPYLFTDALFHHRPLIQFGDGSSARDYTYIDDIVSGLLALKATENKNMLINLGNNQPVTLNTLINIIERHTKLQAKRIIEPRKKEESYRTWADIKHTQTLLHWKPTITFEQGMKRFIAWYKHNRL